MRISETLSKQETVMQDETENSTNNTVLFLPDDFLPKFTIAAILIFVGFCCLVIFFFCRYCRRKREAKSVLQLSSPPLRRRFSEHPVYPPTPPIYPHPLLELTASFDTLPECELDSTSVQAVFASKSADQNAPVRDAERGQLGASPPPEGETTVSIAMPVHIQPVEDTDGQESQQTPSTAEPKCEQTRCLSACELNLNTVQDSNTLSRNL